MVEENGNFLENLNLLTGDSNLIDFLSSNADAMGFIVRSVGNSNGWIPSRNCVTNGIAMCELHCSHGRPAIRVMLKSSGTKTCARMKNVKREKEK